VKVILTKFTEGIGLTKISATKFFASIISGVLLVVSQIILYSEIPFDATRPERTLSAAVLNELLVISLFCSNRTPLARGEIVFFK
jgi:hypothetical protein